MSNESNNKDFYVESSSCGEEDVEINQSELINMDEKSFDMLCKSPVETNRMKKYRKRRSDCIKIVPDAAASALSPPTTDTSNLNESSDLNDSLQEMPSKNLLKSRNNSMPNIANPRIFKSMPSPYQRRTDLKLNLHKIPSFDINKIEEDLINSNNNIKVDSISRINFFQKFTDILKHLTRQNQVTTPTAYGSHEAKSFEISCNFIKQETKELSYTSPAFSTLITQQDYILKTFSSGYYKLYNSGHLPTIETLASHSTNNIWFDLYSYFELYLTPVSSTNEARERVEEMRREKSTIIDKIINLDFKFYTCWLEQEISSKLNTTSDYRMLNDYQDYLTKLVFFHGFIEQLLEELDAFESLYPSLRHLVQSEERYASVDFQNRLKSLALWYNITSELMRQSDLFGRFLGFTKRDWFSKQWIWFERQQSYSQEYYDKIKSNSSPTDNDSPHLPEVRGANFALFRTQSSSTCSFLDMSRQNSNVLNSQQSCLSFLDDGKKREQIYQDFINKRLCKQNLSDIIKKILDMSGNTLPRALKTLDGSSNASKNRINSNFFKYHWMPLHKKCSDYISKFYDSANDDEDNYAYGIHSESFKKLNLPSFRPLYLFLINCIIDLMSTCIKIYINNHTSFQLPDQEISLLTTEQLTHESRECIEHAILVSQYYYYMVFGAFDEEHFEKYPIENDLTNYDNDLKELIRIYLNHVNNWVHDKANGEPLSVLEHEWNFCKNNLCFVNVAENSYAKRFCTINCGIITSLCDNINQNGLQNAFIDALNNAKYEKFDQETNEFLYEEQQQQIDANFDTKILEDDQQTFINDQLLDEFNHDSERQVNIKYNELKVALRDLRDKSVKALNFCRLFMNDLELAAKYQIVSQVSEFLKELKLTSQYYLVKFTDYSIESTMIFVPKSLANDKEKILQLLSMTSGRDDTFYEKVSTDGEKTVLTTPHSKRQIKRIPSANNYDSNNKNVLHTLSMMASINETCKDDNNSHVATNSANTLDYILYLELSKMSSNIERDLRWSGPILELNARLDVKLSLYEHKNDSQENNLFLIVTDPKLLDKQRITLKQNLKKHITLIKEKTSFHPNIAEGLDELNRTIVSSLRDEAVKMIKSMEDDTTLFYQKDNKEIINPSLLLDLWRLSYNFGIELHHECTKFVTADLANLRLAKEFSKGLAQFCINWCEYVMSKVNEGNGCIKKPSWAIKGFELLKEAFKPRNSEHLECDEYVHLRQTVEKCLTHIIGKKSARVSQQKLDGNDVHSKRFNKSISVPTISVGTMSSNENGSSVDRLSDRFQLACSELDQVRESYLEENKRIGRVLKTIPSERHPAYNINAKRVNFRWQRGNKIGEGQFGTVYACFNLNSGQVMAMKEIQFKSNDIQTMKTLADEISNIEGINHENLVQFYGVELHKKEILIFMEFCGDKSTLDRISRESSGLPEELVRSYTNSLLKAVYALHEKAIIHRDIKGANIFLKTTNDGKTILKLGDFGCSVKFRTDPMNTMSTRAFVANDFKGTLAFMAPEVITADTKGAGYTFKADIWSVGCVVIEMITGKRPWNSVREVSFIMYKVCNLKEHPPYPNEINKETTDFLDHCFTFDPNVRWSAADLLSHTFARISIN